MIQSVFPGALCDWKRINYGHRDGTRLQLNVTEFTSGTKIGSVTQSDMEPGRLGPGAQELERKLALFKETMQEA